jgi:hypothetical protein
VEMIGNKGHMRSPDLRRVWIRSDKDFITNLRKASKKEGSDIATFLRKAADARISQVLFADNGDINHQTDTQSNT